MPKQNKIIKDGQIITDTWQLITDEIDLNSISPEENVIMPLAVWQAQPELKARQNVAVWLNNDTDLSHVAGQLTNLPLIAIDFPGFMDGRGFSLARLLRERYDYKGEIRAIGHIIRDMLPQALWI